MFPLYPEAWTPQLVWIYALLPLFGRYYMLILGTIFYISMFLWELFPVIQVVRWTSIMRDTLQNPKHGKSLVQLGSQCCESYLFHYLFHQISWKIIDEHMEIVVSWNRAFEVSQTALKHPLLCFSYFHWWQHHWTNMC